MLLTTAPGAPSPKQVVDYSVPFFLHPNPDFVIDVLPSCIDAAHLSRYPEPISANGYLQERLREIRLI